jgi:hypothetical protein
MPEGGGITITSINTSFVEPYHGYDRAAAAANTPPLPSPTKQLVSITMNFFTFLNHFSPKEDQQKWQWTRHGYHLGHW